MVVKSRRAYTSIWAISASAPAKLQVSPTSKSETSSGSARKAQTEGPVTAKIRATRYACRHAEYAQPEYPLTLRHHRLHHEYGAPARHEIAQQPANMPR